jgi:opacity protein-like surface antigen
VSQKTSQQIRHGYDKIKLRTFTIANLAIHLALFCSGRPAWAQLTSLPVSISPKQTPDLSTLVAHGDYGFCSHNIGDYNAIAGRLIWNPGRYSVMAGSGVLIAEEDELDNGFTVGAGLGYDVRPGSEFLWRAIIQVKVGLGYSKIDDSEMWNIPIGIAAAMYAPPGDLNVKIWGLPRLHLRITDDPEARDDSSSTDVGFGVSAGLAITLSSGPGVHLDGEWLRINGHSEFVTAAGLHWDFTLW